MDVFPPVFVGRPHPRMNRFPWILDGHKLVNRWHIYIYIYMQRSPTRWILFHNLQPSKSLEIFAQDLSHFCGLVSYPYMWNRSWWVYSTQLGSSMTLIMMMIHAYMYHFIFYFCVDVKMKCVTNWTNETSKLCRGSTFRGLLQRKQARKKDYWGLLLGMSTWQVDTMNLGGKAPYNI